MPLWAASCCGACLSGQSSGAWGELRGQRAVRAGGGAHTACPLPFPPLAPPFARRLVQGPYESAALDEDGPGGRPGRALAAQLAASPGRFNGGRDACAGLTVVMPCYMPNEEAIIMDGACLLCTRAQHWRHGSRVMQKRIRGGRGRQRKYTGEPRHIMLPLPAFTYDSTASERNCDRRSRVRTFAVTDVLP